MTSRPEPVCSKCGEEMDYSFEVQVITNRGEEGYSDVTMLLCEDHLEPVLEGLKALGFLNHDHGGTSFLQDENCPGGYDHCPTPTDAHEGTYYIGNYSFSPGKNETSGRVNG